MVREPLGRVVSAWHYRCHNPNWDCFHIDGVGPVGGTKRLHDDWYVRPPMLLMYYHGCPSVSSWTWSTTRIFRREDAWE